MTSGVTVPDPALLARDRGIQLPCQTHDSGLWYPEASDPEAAEKSEAARWLCNTSCPLQLECLTRSLARREPYGIWGGLSESDRRTVLQGKRPRDPQARAVADRVLFVAPAAAPVTAAATAAA